MPLRGEQVNFLEILVDGPHTRNKYVFQTGAKERRETAVRTLMKAAAREAAMIWLETYVHH